MPPPLPALRAPQPEKLCASSCKIACLTPRMLLVVSSSTLRTPLGRARAIRLGLWCPSRRCLAATSCASTPSQRSCEEEEEGESPGCWLLLA